jgi:iron-sulfur cluster repair protein YtfE (RIC family)
VDTSEQRRIKVAISSEHALFDLLLAEVIRSVADGEFERAGATFDELTATLGKHMEFEEDVLFPIFDSAMRSEPGSGPTAGLRRDHDRIRELLGEMAAALEASAREAFDRAASALQTLLPEHDVQEHAILHRVVHRILGPLGTRVLASRFAQLKGP